MRDAQCKERQGFTLIELLVGLILTGGLVAYVFPVVMQQLDRWQAVAVARDLRHLRLGLEAFHLNTGDYPIQLTQLVNPIAGGDSNLSSRIATIGSMDGVAARRWNGPYVDEPLAASLLDEDGFGTGWDAQIANGVVCIDRTRTVSACGKGKWVAIFVGGLRAYQFEMVNEIIDEGEVDLDGPSMQSQGRLVFAEDDGVEAGTSPGWTFYLAIPYLLDE